MIVQHYCTGRSLGGVAGENLWGYHLGGLHRKRHTTNTAGTLHLQIRLPLQTAHPPPLTLDTGPGRWVDDSTSTLQLPQPDQFSEKRSALGRNSWGWWSDRMRSFEFAQIKTRSFEFKKNYDQPMRVNTTTYTLAIVCILLLGVRTPSLPIRPDRPLSFKNAHITASVITCVIFTGKTNALS